MEQFEQLMQAILKKIIKNSTKLEAENTNNFKRMYAWTLRKPEKLSGQQLTQHLLKALAGIQNIFQEMSTH